MSQTDKINKLIYKALQEFSQKRITLEELNDICPNCDGLYEQITELSERGVLTPIKSSEKNGNQKKTAVYAV